MACSNSPLPLDYKGFIEGRAPRKLTGGEDYFAYPVRLSSVGKVVLEQKSRSKRFFTCENHLPCLPKSFQKLLTGSICVRCFRDSTPLPPTDRFSTGRLLNKFSVVFVVYQVSTTVFNTMAFKRRFFFSFIAFLSSCIGVG